MHSVRPARRRSSSAIRSSIRELQPRERRDQSRLVGARFGGSLASSPVVDHPVFPGKPGPAARRIETDDDVREVIELIRLNYDRVVARYGLPAEAA